MKQMLELGLFGASDTPSVKAVWERYQRGLDFNASIRLDETVKQNENFYIGKQWEGVNAKGLPTPQFNILKRVTGFIVATITTDSIKVSVSAMPGTAENVDWQARIVNDEFDALNEINDLPALIRAFAKNAAVDGDACIYTYWDAEADCGGGIKGAIRDELIDNTCVFFANPNSSDVQSQPYIIISSRESLRSVRKRAIKNGLENAETIQPDENPAYMDSAKYVDDKATVLLTLFRDEETGEIMAYESTRTACVRDCWGLGIKRYPICWLSWDRVKDSYHGQAMLTGLIPNQIFINKAWAMTMLSITRSAFPKIIYDKTRIRDWDNRVGAAIGINGGDTMSAARIIESAEVSPQISGYINLAVEETEHSLGATAVALGDAKPQNTSAILALQRAAATPSETTRQNLYRAIEEHARIQMEFMGEYYGERYVRMPLDEGMRTAYELSELDAPESVRARFDFAWLKDNPLRLKLDVGASAYYSEIAAMQSLDNLLSSGKITTEQYLERIPDGYVPEKRKLIDELRSSNCGG